MTDPNDPNSWIHHRMFIVESLRAINGRLDSMDKKIDEVHDDVLTLKTKAALWGGMAAAVVGPLTAFLFSLIKDRLHHG